ncbi:ATP-binding protein [Streptomyces sp. NPDC056296]|uniref:ATP-binding protein n=1 Tax=Streptomyces sp. NPDC056296 TaxID=3345775 RepID=UPI0035E19D65
MLVTAPAVSRSIPRFPASPQRALLAVAAQPARMRSVRRWADGLLRHWGIAASACDSVVLVVAELATNAVLHGRGDMTLSLALSRGLAHVAVVDSGAMTVSGGRADTAPDEHGRGLELVRALALSTGHHQSALGRRAWAVVRVDDSSDGAAGAPRPSRVRRR